MKYAYFDDGLFPVEILWHFKSVIVAEIGKQSGNRQSNLSVVTPVAYIYIHFWKMPLLSTFHF